MADSKKKSAAKKTVKKTDSKTAKSKAAAAKTKTVEAKTASKKTANIKENKKVKKPVSKKPVKKQDVKKEKHVSDMAKEDVNSFWKIIAGIAVVIFLILMVAVLASMNSDNAIVKGDLNNDTSMSENYGDNMSNTMEDSPIQTSDLEVSLLLIEDPACTTCQVDLYVSQLKEFLFPNLKVEKLSLESEEAKDIIEELGIVQVPVYLFSDNLDQLSNWETDLADKFAKIPLNSKEYFALNPLYIPIKSLVNKPIIDENTVVIGNKSAKLTIYEFSDYECPYCAIAEGNEELLQQYLIQDPSFVPPMEGVFKDYVETGKVKFVFFNLPLEQLHPDVMPAHLAAMCANNQDKWLDFHKKLFKSRSEWVSSQSYTDKMKEFAKELGLDEKEFASCLDSEKYLSQIENEIVQSFSLGVTGTPAFVVGNIFVPGVRDYTVMKAIIEEELNN